jgi:antibiotic biosynthesis monooxygenase (ABM) superfamily enzyme
MNRRTSIWATAVAFGFLSVGAAIAAEQPHSIIHVITVKWKDDATEDQINKAIRGAEQLAKDYPGIQRIWTKTLKVQGKGYKNAIVMEFANEDAFKKYADSPAQKKWYEVYMPIREESTTHDITN